MDGNYLRERLRNLNIDLAEIAKRLNISPQALNSKLNAKDLRFSFIREVAKVVNKSVYELIGESFNKIDSIVEFSEEAERGVPYYDIDFTASFLEIHNDQKSIPDHYVSHPFFQGCDYIVRASGQSMAKVIKHGDAIGLVEIKNWQEFIPLGEIYAIVTKNQFRMIKIITKGDDNSCFTLISKPMDGKKEEFPPQQIKKDQILSIFRVQASSHLF